MPDTANTEGAKITADNNSPSNIQSRWSFLKDLREKVASKFKKPEPKPESENQVAPKTMRKKSGSTERIAVQAIEVLLEDFYKYIDTLGPAMGKMIKSVLNNGNEDLIDALARIKLDQYNKNLKDGATQSLSREQLKEKPMHEGFKKIMAQNLIQAMGNRIQRKYHRESAGSTRNLALIASGEAIKTMPQLSIPSQNVVSQAEQIIRNKQQDTNLLPPTQR